MLRILKITGESLSPTHNPGDYVLISTRPKGANALKSGEIVVFKHPVYGTMVKRVVRVFPKDEKIFVTGSHPQSIDSRQFGPIPQSWVIGKVVWHIPHPGSST